MNKGYHIPVLLEEAVNSLKIDPKGTYIDCTLGEGGHSFEIVSNLNPEGKLLSIDQDDSAIEFVQKKYSELIDAGNWIIVKGNFENILSIATTNGIVKADGILMDLGISSRQLEEKGRGFSYMKEDEILDMRMNKDLSVSALDLITVLTVPELEKLFRTYGEERFSRKIAQEIKRTGVKTVGDLTSLIYRVVPATSRSKDSHHPARRVFQALRIAVNDEINSLRKGLDNAYELLNKGGRLSVITFHSLEEREVNLFFKKKVDLGSIELPLILPSQQEILRNNRSRSAKLRVLEK